MDRRRDALLGAAEVVIDVNRIARTREPLGRATVCRVDVEPNAGSVIAGGARLLVDLRHPDIEQLDRMEAALHSSIARRAEQRGVAAATRDTWTHFAIAFDPEQRRRLEASAAALGHETLSVLSGAGHDAGYVARVVPAAMLFVACRDGVSHHPDESVEPEDAAAGTATLLGSVIDAAG